MGRFIRYLNDIDWIEVLIFSMLLFMIVSALFTLTPLILLYGLKWWSALFLMIF